jgi:thymidine kinase
MIRVLTGPMKSGKSKVLSLIYNKEPGVACTADLDTRTHAFITSRAKGLVPIPAIPIKDLSEIPFTTNKIFYIDEAQFITDDHNTIQVIKYLSEHGYKFYFSGLDEDSDQQPFGIMPNLIKIADEVLPLTADCELCGEPASHTKCRIKKDTTILCGDDIYYPICDDCLKGGDNHEEGR